MNNKRIEEFKKDKKHVGGMYKKFVSNYPVVLADRLDIRLKEEHGKPIIIKKIK